MALQLFKRKPTKQIVEIFQDESPEQTQHYIENTLKRKIEQDISPYKTSLFEFRSSIYRTISQHTISSLGNIVVLPIVGKELHDKQKDYQFIHLGVIVVGLISLTRHGIGASVHIF